MAEAISRLAAIRDDLDRNYQSMLGAVLELGLSTAVCTQLARGLDLPVVHTAELLD